MGSNYHGGKSFPLWVCIPRSFPLSVIFSSWFVDFGSLLCAIPFSFFLSGVDSLPISRFCRIPSPHQYAHYDNNPSFSVGFIHAFERI